MPKYTNRNISETINSIVKIEDQADTNSCRDQQLHFVGGLILYRSNAIWLPAAILKKMTWRLNSAVETTGKDIWTVCERGLVIIEQEAHQKMR